MTSKIYWFRFCELANKNNSLENKDILRTKWIIIAWFKWICPVPRSLYLRLYLRISWTLVRTLKVEFRSLVGRDLNVDGMNFQNTSLSVLPLRGSCLGFHVFDRARPRAELELECVWTVWSGGRLEVSLAKDLRIFTEISPRSKRNWPSIGKERNPSNDDDKNT